MYGNEIATLVDEFKLAGKYEIEFNAKISSSGLYFCRLKTDNNFYKTIKMVL